MDKQEGYYDSIPNIKDGDIVTMQSHVDPKLNGRYKFTGDSFKKLYWNGRYFERVDNDSRHI